MAGEVKERVFILRKIRYGDADLILHALTPKGARVSLFARSALKSRKRFGGGVLEPTHFVNVLYEEKKGRHDHPLCTLKEASLVEGFPGLRSDYSRLEAALHFVQVVNEVSREGDVHAHEIFNLLGNALRAAETTASLMKLRIHFETKLLAHHGVLPIQEEEAVLLRAPIAEHERAALDDLAWQVVQARIQRVMTDFLEHLPRT